MRAATSHRTLPSGVAEALTLAVGALWSRGRFAADPRTFIFQAAATIVRIPLPDVSNRSYPLSAEARARRVSIPRRMAVAVKGRR